MPNLAAAVRVIHQDRDWWRKIAVGGGFWLTVVGWPIVEGHQLESLENSQRGFPTPLPRWVDLRTKSLVGFFALIIDFFYFVLPVLAGMVLVFCGAVGVQLTTSSAASSLVARAAVGLTALYIGLIWFSGVSAVAKQRYVANSDWPEIMSGQLIRDLLRPPALPIYMRARLLSLPAYGVCLGLSAMVIVAGRWSIAAALVMAWAALATLLYARLVTVQLYLQATRELAESEWQADGRNGNRAATRPRR